MNNDVTPTYSISLRLQRTTEFAFVSVTLTEDLMLEQPDGTIRLDADKFMQTGLKLRHDSGLKWQLEEQQIQPHSIQTPPE